ncbi:TnsD family Tn7-like transposition protein [Paenibacillus ottowii]
MNRLLYFPEPLPDEDFRSLIFRYHIRSGNTEMIQSKYDLFGVRSYKHTFFPKRLQPLLDRLPLGHTFTVDQLIYDHTWYGLYKSFFTEERHITMVNVIKNGSISSKINKGYPMISPIAIIPAEIKYCPQCVYSDYEQYGEVYLHRGHQVSFLNFCPIHSVQLVSRCPICDSLYGSTQSGQLLQEPFCKNGHALTVERVNIKEMGNQFQLELLDDLLYVRNHYRSLSAQEIKIKFYEQLFAQGYITLTGLFHKKRLLSDFKKWSLAQSNTIFIKNFMDTSMYFSISLLKSDSMVQYIVFYLLLARFLGESLTSLLSSQKSCAMSIPFGNGPWSCHNSNCINIGTPVISKCKRRIIDGTTGKLLISYTCSYCGCDNMIQAFYSRIKSSWTKRRITVRKPLMPTEVALAYEQVATAADITTSKWERRAKLTELLSQNSLSSRFEIRKESEFLYCWLMKNDKEWMEKVLPNKTPRNKVKLDFDILDKQLLFKIRDAVTRIDPEYKRPIRKKTIINLLETSDGNKVINYQRQLPLSMEEINKYVESTKDFLIRSIPRNYAKIVKRGCVLMTVYEFKMKASITYYLHGDEEVDKHIHDFLREKGALIDR